jgi:hexosaminidase
MLLLAATSIAQTILGQYPELVPLIPEPVSIIKTGGTITLPQKIVISYADKRLAFTAGYLKDRVSTYTGKAVQVQYTGEKESLSQGTLVLSISRTIEQPEGYRLKIEKRKIIIEGINPQGIFYGVQSLNQLLFNCKNARGKITLPCMEIFDYPRFSWRGLHLDVGRHFFDKEFIRKYIDILALHKMNTLHWHLVDDQGWRIEIKKYPKLTAVGAWRVNHEDMPWNSRPDQKPGEQATYGGFYTQQEIKEIVAYAAQRFITVVPEIEMPAHVTSALAAYPEYSCRQVPLTVPSGGVWPITNIYCAGNDSTFLFIQDILTEVLDLFPSKYIHIGGDEADKTEWRQCSKCQARIKTEMLKDENELQSYFVRRIGKFLTEKQRILIGWDEILEGGLAENATVMSWRGTEGGIDAARMKHNVVMTPGTHCYFDHYQSLDIDIEPEAIGGFTDLSKVYSFEPVPEILTDDESRYILGAQGNVWTEYMLSGNHVEYMILPRATAIAEVLWTPVEKKDYNDFLQRLKNQLNLLTFNGINYYLPTVDGLIKNRVFNDTARVELRNPFGFGDIRYTLDGSEPGQASSRYKKPFFLKKSTTVKAAVFLANGRSGKVKTAQYTKQESLEE